MFERLAYRGYLFGLEVVDLFSLRLWKRSAGGDVDGDETLFDRLLKHRGYEPVMFKHGLGRERPRLAHEHEGVLELQAELSGHDRRVIPAHTLAFDGGVDLVQRQTALLGELHAGQAELFQHGSEVGFGARPRAALGAAGLQKLGVQAVEVVWAQVAELYVADGRVYALGQVAVADDSRVLRAALFFQLYDIITVGGELPSPVGGQTVFTLLFKGRGESLGLFSRGFLAPRGYDVEGRRPRLELPPVQPTPAKNADGVRDKLAGLVPAGLEVSHCRGPPFPLRQFPHRFSSVRRRRIGGNNPLFHCAVISLDRAHLPSHET